MGFNVLTAEISHETNSFSLQKLTIRPADGVMSCWAQKWGQASTVLAGILDRRRVHGWYVNHLLSAAAGPSGEVKRSTFDWLSDPILSTIQQHQFDGLLLGLHDAMDLDCCEDGEDELL